MGKKISKWDSHQQFNKNNGVAWGKALDNDDEEIAPNSGAPGPDKKIVMSETFFEKEVEEVNLDEIPAELVTEEIEGGFEVVEDDAFEKLQAELGEEVDVMKPIEVETKSKKTIQTKTK